MLDVVETQDWTYKEAWANNPVDATSMSGKFVTVWYSLRNTGDYPLLLDLYGELKASGQYFQQTYDVSHPISDAYQLELQPRDVTISAFVFDVPEDVKPEMLTIIQGTRDQGGSMVAEVDLTRVNLEAVPPDETLALSYEFYNAEHLDLAYDLYSSDAQAQVTFDQFARGNEGSPTISDYAFPSVRINGARSEVERTLTEYDPRTFEEDQERKIQPLIREDGVWRIEMRPDQLEYYQQQ